jgi:succinate dehydrogenase / fumarate reductase cytochrome b subunit
MLAGLLGFYRSSVGKKVIMGVTGVILVVFVISHVFSNLLVFQGPEGLDRYAAFLRSTGKGLWLVRAGASRPQGYVKRESQASTWGARSMRWGGALLLVFIIFHLFHFTFGNAHPTYPNFNHTTVYRNVITGFPSIWLVLFYEAAMLALGLHLYHGTVAMVMSLGGSHPRYTPLWRRVATILAIGVTIGFMVIPVAVYFHLVR